MYVYSVDKNRKNVTLRLSLNVNNFPFPIKLRQRLSFIENSTHLLYHAFIRYPIPGVKISPSFFKFLFKIKSVNSLGTSQEHFAVWTFQFYWHLLQIITFGKLKFFAKLWKSFSLTCKFSFKKRQKYLYLFLTYYSCLMTIYDFFQSSHIVNAKVKM